METRIKHCMDPKRGSPPKWPLVPGLEGMGPTYRDDQRYRECERSLSQKWHFIRPAGQVVGAGTGRLLQP